MPRFIFLLIPLTFITSAYAAPTELSNSANDPDIGTFSVTKEKKVEKQKMEEQLIMEKEEAVEADSFDAFGENKYNLNHDPDIYKEEEPKSKPKGAR